MNLLIDNYELPIVEDERRTGYSTTNFTTLTSPQTSPSTVIVYERIALYFNRHAYQILSSISKLADNWDGEDAIAPTESVLIDAHRCLTLLTMVGQKIYNLAPGPNGEIMISLKGKSGELELLFYPNKTKYVKLPNTGSPTQGKLIFNELFDLLKWLVS